MLFHAFSCFFMLFSVGRMIYPPGFDSGLERYVSTRERLGGADSEKSRGETFGGRLRSLERCSDPDCSRPQPRAGGQGDATQNP
jgi:hypothetical protein